MRGSFRKPRRQLSSDDSILPLINVVFLLLIFFMVVGRLSASDPFEVIPPHSVNQGEPAQDDMLIAIGAEGELALNGEIITEDHLIAAVTAAKVGELRIKTDNRASALATVALIEELRGVGVASVRLMTVPELGGGD
ncbi:MAG: biopolymer transporter ExbD [Pseudomonadota bacterium]